MRFRYIIWCVCSIHLSWAVMLWVTPDVLGATPLAPFTGYSLPRQLISLALCIASLLPLLIFLRPMPIFVDFLLVLPQQTFLFHSAAASLSAIISGSFADGARYPRAFIAGGEAATVWVAVWHSIALASYLRGDMGWREGAILVRQGFYGLRWRPRQRKG